MSSSTAVVTGPMSTGSCVNLTPSARSRSNSAVMSLTAKDVNGNPVADECFLERLGRRMGVRLEDELGSIGILGRDDGQPSVLAEGDLGLLLEAEHFGVEPQRLVLVVDEDA